MTVMSDGLLLNSKYIKIERESSWIGSGNIRPLEFKECNLEMTCPQPEPSVLTYLMVQCWDLFFLFYTLMTLFC